MPHVSLARVEVEKLTLRRRKRRPQLVQVVVAAHTIAIPQDPISIAVGVVGSSRIEATSAKGIASHGIGPGSVREVGPVIVPIVSCTGISLKSDAAIEELPDRLCTR